jgi:hypothetical protein
VDRDTNSAVTLSLSLAAFDLITALIAQAACATLSSDMKPPRRRNYEYPEKTRGSEAARRLRTKANKLTSAQRAELHRRAMQLIYGGAGNKEALRSG